MKAWFRRSPWEAKNGNSNGRNRKGRKGRRSIFDRLPNSLERLEDRVPLAADLAMNMSASPTTTVVPGALVTYTIHAQNLAAGTTAATGVMVTDTLPTGETFVDATVTGPGSPTVAGSSGTLTVTANLGTLKPGDTDVITIQALIDTTATGMLTNPASMTNTSGDTNPPNATVNSTVNAAAPTNNVSVTKDSVPSGAIGTVGASLTYQVIITNNTFTPAAGVQLFDQLDPNETFVSASDTKGDTFTNVGGTITTTMTSLGGGVTDTVTIVALPTKAAGIVGGVTNTASIAVPSGNLSTNVVANKTNTVLPAAVGGTNHAGAGFLQGVPGDGTPQTFVQNLYRELLGREPDSAGDAFWVGFVQQHNTAAGRSQTVQAFMNSPEYAVHYVTTVYEIVLGRAPDAPGLQFWTQKMGQPGTPANKSGSADEKAIVAAFFGSDEFFIKSGNTPQGWINALYEDLLGRAPDGSGAAFWANELAVRGSGDRDGIVRDLLTMPEAAHFVLDTFYPTPGGTASTPLAAPGTTAGTGRDDLSQLTGAGWENLSLQGPFGSQSEGNDVFFASLAGGGNWGDVQLLMLSTDQFYTNPNRPISG
ncbi:MAG TPA: DUF4214 domain-containing protein [Pirellulales bacterium]|nr:DUF4214 domain-containing protein [Pirellulales bacterium]